MGVLAPSKPNKQYKTRHFLEFTIKDVDQITEYIQLNGETIPLHSLSVWRRYYELMGRTSKVEMIDH
ncbi:MAG: hypothetical protein LUH21_13885 [Clostridiales bacterium]|nr:hypothetical protein [Clostridiales bacterium]